jgi:hypothetical protein
VHGKVHTVRRVEDVSIIAVEAAKSSTQGRATAYCAASQARAFAGKPQIRLWKIGGYRKTEVEKSVQQSNLESAFFNHIPAFDA